MKTERIIPTQLLPRSIARKAVVTDGNRIEIFKGEPIDGLVVAATEVEYHKNGKWSYAVYEAVLHDHVEVRYITPDYGTRRYINHWDPEGIRKDLGMEDIPIPVVMDFVRRNFPRVWEKIVEIHNKLESLENKGTREIKFSRFYTPRAGYPNLLVDGEHVPEREFDNHDKIVVMSHSDNGAGGRFAEETWTLVVPKDVEVRILSDAEMRERGYKYDSEKWVKPAGSGNTVLDEQMTEELKKKMIK